MSPVKVISQQPPGGRCTLYARYADAVSESIGWSHTIVHSEERDAHGDGFPGLWIRDVSLQPEDYFILTPEEVCRHLSGLGIEQFRLDTLLVRLQAIHAAFLEPAGKTSA
jgi:cystathionine gamma-synthase